MNHSNLYQILTRIKNEANLDGIIFAHRNGESISENIEESFASKNFVSMCASMLESAVRIGETIRNKKIKKIIAELEKKIITIFECDDKTFLILIISKKSKANYIINKIEEDIEKIIQLS